MIMSEGSSALNKRQKLGESQGASDWDPTMPDPIFSSDHPSYGVIEKAIFGSSEPVAQALYEPGGMMPYSYSGEEYNPEQATAISQGATGNKYIDGLLSGTKWSGTITFSFPQLYTDYGPSYSTGEQYNSFRPLTNQGQEATRAILGGFTSFGTSGVSTYGSLASLISTSVQQTTNFGQNGLGDIRSAESRSANPTAYAYYPNNATSGVGGDVWYGNGYAGTVNDYRNPVLGGYAYHTYIHELGHALGLKHGHEVGGVASTAVPADRDAIEFTVMTYRPYLYGPTNGYTYERWGAPQSFMMLDIAALQTMYGADYTTNNGDTVYQWNPSTGQMFLNGIGQGTPGGNRVFLTIWDGGGNDTYDMSNYTNGVAIHLTPGLWSVTSETQRALLGTGVKAQGTVYNALLFNGDTRSVIENAIGGSGNDVIYGNGASNVLRGNAGNDTLFGGEASDWLYGGPDYDIAEFSNNLSQVTITRFLALDEHNALQRRIKVSTLTEGVDTLQDIERIKLGDGSVFLGPFREDFDGLFYALKNGDVYRAGVNSFDHFMANGWREGRDPSAQFSVNGYLGAYRDVAGAGVNPLVHYSNGGWREGRDPSLNFDTNGYLGLNPDVKAAGINPLIHYLVSGQYEGRQTAKMVGSADQYGFDAQFYLMKYEDVARAGVDPSLHFYQGGWKEGRNPNNYFDTAGYLAKYTDVKAAGINPLMHYSGQGWKENRDPSKEFDTSIYLSNYADVDAADINPFYHYLGSGINEGRKVFGDGAFD